MTVCISAIAASSKAIVCIADRALTYTGYGASSENDSGVTKIVELPGVNWCAMFSGEDLTFPKRILDKVFATLTKEANGNASLPMVTHLFLNDPSNQEMKEQFNASAPSEDLERFAKSIADVAEKMTAHAGSATDPAEYGRQIAGRLCPDILPYELGTTAIFEVGSFNGRALGDDVLDVMLTLAANTPLADGLAPDRGRIRKDFPYYGAPYTAEEQVGVTPMPRPAKK